MLTLPVTTGNGYQVEITYYGVGGRLLDKASYPFDLRAQALLYTGDMNMLYTQSALTYQSAEVFDSDRWEYVLDTKHPHGVAISANGRIVTRIVITLSEVDNLPTALSRMSGFQGSVRCRSKA